MSTAASPIAALSLDQFIALNDEMSALVRAGVPLDAGLARVGAEISGRLGRTAEGLAERLRRGESLAQVMDAEPQAFPPLYRAAIEAGIRSGRLAVALEQWAATARRVAELRAMVGYALFYPLLVVLAAYVLFVLFMVDAAPTIAGGYEFFRRRENGWLEFVVAWGRTAHLWAPLPPLALLGGVGWWWWRSGRAAGGNAHWSLAFWGWAPWARRMLAYSRAAGFADIAALLLEQGASLDESLKLAADSTGHAALRRDAERAAAAVRQGRGLATGGLPLAGLPPLLTWLCGGRRGAALPAALRHAAESYHRRAVEQAELARVFVPVILTVFLGGAATLAYAVGILSPWFELLRHVERSPGVNAWANGKAFVAICPMPHDPWSETAGDGAAGRLSAADAGQLAARLAELTQAQLPLDEGLAALADELPRGRLPRTLREVARRLHAGAPLEETLNALQGRLPAHLRGLVSAGLRSGGLGEALEQFAHQQRVSAELRRKVWMTLLYPTLLLAGTLLLLLLCARLVVPGLTEVLLEFEVDLPRQTQFLLWLTKDAQWILWAALLALPIGAVALRLSGQAPLLRRLACGLPGIGPLWSWIGLAEWSRMLSLLLRQQVPLPQALRLTAEGVADAGLAAASRALSARIEAGTGLGAAVAAEPALPPTLAPIVDWGERHAALPEALQAAGDLFEGRVKVQMTLLETVLPLLSFLVVSSVVLFLASAMFSVLILTVQTLGMF